MKKAIQGGAIFLLSAAALAWGGCASKKGGTAVLVVTDPEVVRGCAFLGRVNQTATESEPAGVGVLRQRTAETGREHASPPRRRHRRSLELLRRIERVRALHAALADAANPRPHPDRPGNTALLTPAPPSVATR